METQTRLSRHNKFISAEWRSFYIYIYKIGDHFIYIYIYKLEIILYIYIYISHWRSF